MPVLKSALERTSEAYQRNRSVQLAAIAAVDEQLAIARAGGGPRYAERHRSRGRLLVRDRIELLLDRDAPFLELSALAAWGTEFTVGASVVTGVGVVSGIECLIIGHDPTVRGGAMNPYSLRKSLRALEIARVNRLPVVNLVESGGADLPTQSDLFVPAGRIFHDLTQLSALGIPTIALVFGNSTAGGAYVPGMCDYAVLVDQQAKVFLGGPPLVKMATGEESGDEELGGALMHSRVSGLSDHFATDEVDCIRIGRQIMTELNWRKAGPGRTGPADEPRYDRDELLGIVSADFRVPFDPREVLARVVDGSRFGEYKPLYGTSLVTGWASVHGFPVGILANERGVLFSEEARKASEFILLANQTDTPLVFLQNTTGYMVGQAYEQGGIIKDGAKMINAVANSTVPHVTINMGASFGAGNYGMSGRAYDPRFMFAWPNAKLAVMGAQQLAGVLSIVGRQAAQAAGLVRRDRGRRAAPRHRGADRAGITRPVRHRPAVRRRDHRPAGHPDRARHRPVRGALRAGAGPPRLRRVPDVRGEQMPAIRKLLIANRGEIAARIIRTARSLDIATVAVFSDADAGAPYLRAADEAVPLPGNAPADTYLNGPAIIAAAQRTGADAVHPGYGFLSENAGFATACAAAGLIFVGPPPDAIAAMGSKIAAKELMAAAGVPVLPSVTIKGDDPPGAEEIAAVGFPLLVKAAFGGGGRGMRVVTRAADLDAALAGARREAAAAFGDGTVFCERYLPSPRHIEVQIFGDAHGGVVHLFERECSIQRRYQKIIEEAPSPAVDADLRRELGAAAVAAGKAIGYTGAGTVEFVLDSSGRGGPPEAGPPSTAHFYFLEVNTRLQVEHPVTELVTGLDLVALQLHVAEGHPLPDEVHAATLTGHAIEARLYAEDIAAGFLPATGTVQVFEIPALPGLRVDAGIAAGSEVGLYYDAMLAKVIAHGPSRDAARRRLARAVAGTRLHGVTSNRELLVGILREPEFAAGRIDTGYLTRHDPAGLAATARDPAAPRLHALAAALAGQAARRAAAPVLRTIPSGWRNVPDSPQHVAFDCDGTEIVVRYQFRGGAVGAEIDGATVEGLLLRCAEPGRVVADIAGVRREFTVAQAGVDWYVDSPLGATRLTELARFPEPGAQAAAGSLIAPMPGTVVRVEVTPGARVTAGTPVVVLEAMKMEHSVRAPHDGVVAGVAVHPGQQVDLGTVLAVVEAADE